MKNFSIAWRRRKNKYKSVASLFSYLVIALFVIYYSLICFSFDVASMQEINVQFDFFFFALTPALCQDTPLLDDGGDVFVKLKGFFYPWTVL